MAQIHEGVVILKHGGLRLIMPVTPLNFALKSTAEQQVIVDQFQGFLNALHFPLQIVVQSRRLDVNRYLKDLLKIRDAQTNPLLQQLTDDYVSFVGRLVSVANIMQKRFWLVLSIEPPVARSTGGFLAKLLKKEAPTATYSQAEFASYKQELLERSQVVRQGLGTMGIRAGELSTEDTIELLYGVYNPDEVVEDRLTEVEEVLAPVVRGEDSSKYQVASSKEETRTPSVEVTAAQLETGAEPKGEEEPVERPGPIVEMSAPILDESAAPPSKPPEPPMVKAQPATTSHYQSPSHATPNIREEEQVTPSEPAEAPVVEPPPTAKPPPVPAPENEPPTPSMHRFGDPTDPVAMSEMLPPAVTASEAKTEERQ